MFANRISELALQLGQAEEAVTVAGREIAEATRRRDEAMTMCRSLRSQIAEALGMKLEPKRTNAPAGLRNQQLLAVLGFGPKRWGEVVKAMVALGASEKSAKTKLSDAIRKGQVRRDENGLYYVTNATERKD